MTITIKPVDNFNVEIDLGNGKARVMHSDEAIGIISVLAQQAKGHIEVYKKFQGWSITTTFQNEVFKAAGMSNFQSAKHIDNIIKL